MAECAEWIEKQKFEPTMEDFEKYASNTDGGIDINHINYQFYDVLSLNLLGESLTMIKGLKKELGINGIVG